MDIVRRHRRHEAQEGQAQVPQIGLRREKRVISPERMKQIGEIGRTGSQLNKGFLSPPEEPRELKRIPGFVACQRSRQAEGNRIGHQQGDD